MSGFQGSISATNPPAAAGSIPVFPTAIMSFSVGDGQPNSPAPGDTSLHVPSLPTLEGGQQSIGNSNLLVIREGIALRYSNSVTTYDIRRFNDGTNGGWTFEPASGLAFYAGENYMIFLAGTNNTIES